MQTGPDCQNVILDEALDGHQAVLFLESLDALVHQVDVLARTKTDRLEVFLLFVRFLLQVELQLRLDFPEDGFHLEVLVRVWLGQESCCIWSNWAHELIVAPMR